MYKRQVTKRLWQPPRYGKIEVVGYSSFYKKGPGDFIETTISVSYTHLDVYKRQVAYNAKKKKTSDKIPDYYEHIRQSKQEKLFHEAIFQIGNMEDLSLIHI